MTEIKPTTAAEARVGKLTREMNVILEDKQPPDVVIFRDASGREVGRLINLQVPPRPDEEDANALAARFSGFQEFPQKVVREVVAWAEGLGQRAGDGGPSLLMNADEAERAGLPKTARILRGLVEAAHGKDWVVCVPPLVFTPKQVEQLNRRQHDTRFHPYTCPGDKPCCAGARDLVATREGWVCACGEYRQTWAHGDAAGGLIGEIIGHLPVKEERA